MAKQAAKLTTPAPEHLAAALMSGDSRIAAAFRKTLDRAAWQHKSERHEEFEAIKGILGAFGRTAEAGSRKALEPTLRHLLARVL
jgi:hypothetical protein